MAHLARLAFIITDPTTGLPINNATVEVRKQGATVNGTTGPTTINIHAQGAIDVGDTVNIDNDADIAVAVLTQPTAVQLTVAAAGFSTLVNDVTRLTPTSPLPTVWNAEEGAETKTNPLTTDNLGEAFCFVPNGLWDALVTVGGVKTLLINQVASGGGLSMSNIFTTGAESAYDFDTARALGTGDKIARFLDDGVTRVSISKSGDITAVTGLFTSDVAIIGNLTLAADLAMSATASQLIPGATSFAIRNNADNADNVLVLDAGDVTIRRDLTVTQDLTVTRDAACRRGTRTGGTAVVPGDFSISSGWGDTALINTPVGTDAAGELRITCQGSGIGAEPFVTFTFPDGAYADGYLCMLTVASNTTTGEYDHQWVASESPGSSASATFFLSGTPTTAKTYNVAWLIIGR